MARKSEQLRTLFRWMEKHDKPNIPARILAEKLREKYDWANIPAYTTLQSQIEKIRCGTYSEATLFSEEVFDDIEANLEEAKVFVRQPAKLDTNPLNVLAPDIKRDFFDIPESYATHKAPLKLDGYGRKMGIISDIHFPIHDRPAVLAAHAYLKKVGVDCLLLMGDIMDLSNLTRHAARKALPYTWREEVEVGRAYFKSLRVLFPDIPIIYAEGNHENWLQQYIIKNSAQLEGTYLLPELLKLSDYNIEWVDESRLMTYGSLFLHHGHRLGLGGGRNIATRLLDKHGANIIVGHWHRVMSDDKRTLGGDLHGAWVNGCLSDLHPDYHPHNNSTHGVSIVSLLDGGMFNVSQHKIVNGMVIGE